jgi:SpoVK/Ycf46/Vps4 family AAA+-type ATPase
LFPRRGLARFRVTEEDLWGGNPDAISQKWCASGTKYWPSQDTHEILPAGAYQCGFSPSTGHYPDKLDLVKDEPVRLPVCEEVILEFKTFWRSRAEYSKRGFLHKRGWLFSGPPGAGKTTLVHQMAALIIQDHNGIVLYVDDPDLAAINLGAIRRIEPDRYILCVFEDIDTLIKEHGESGFLALLDGQLGIDHVVFVATANYLQDLDKRFVNRPARFDVCRWIGMPGADIRRKYFQQREPSLTGEVLEEWVEKSKGFSIAHLREMIVAVTCLGQDLSAVVDRLERMYKRQPTSDDSVKVSGFLSGREVNEDAF